MKRSRKHKGVDPDARSLEDIRLPSSERLAINATSEFVSGRVLCCTIGRGQCAVELANRCPESDVTLHFLDLYQAAETNDYLETQLPNLRIICSPDFPNEEFDLFVLPLTKGGEAELARELLQQGFSRLKVGGELVATVDNNKDTWLMHEIETLGRNVGRIPKRHGLLYRLRKLKELKRLRDFTCEFTFRDGEHLIEAVSRPGVFSHRRLDLGARALIETMEIPPGARVLDIGCGSGAVGLAAGMRHPDVTVHAIDSNARAVQCAAVGAQINQLERFTTGLTATGELIHDGTDLTGTFDVAVGNPPYFSHFQIAEIFLQTARNALRPGGRVWMVTKHEEWMIARMEQIFSAVQVQECRGYTVVSAVKSDGGNGPQSA